MNKIVHVRWTWSKGQWIGSLSLTMFWFDGYDFLNPFASRMNRKALEWWFFLCMNTIKKGIFIINTTGWCLQLVERIRKFIIFSKGFEIVKMIFEQYRVRSYTELCDTKWNSFRSEYAYSKWSLESGEDSRWRLEISFLSEQALQDSSFVSPLWLVGKGLKKEPYRGKGVEQGLD